MVGEAPGVIGADEGIDPVVGAALCGVEGKDEVTGCQESVSVCQGFEKGGDCKCGQPGQAYGDAESCCPVYGLGEVEIGCVFYNIEEGNQQDGQDQVCEKDTVFPAEYEGIQHQIGVETTGCCQEGPAKLPVQGKVYDETGQDSQDKRGCQQDVPQISFFSHLRPLFLVLGEWGSGYDPIRKIGGIWVPPVFRRRPAGSERPVRQWLL